MDEIGVTASGGTYDRSDRVLGIVLELLETQGYDAVQLREVARRTRISLATVYKRYGTRDELILAALETWMEEHRYSGVPEVARQPGESLYQALMRLFCVIFEPWEQHPGMLTAYFRARSGPGGQRLVRRGFDVVVPTALELLGGADDTFIADLDTVVSSVVYGLVGRFVAGELAITEILPGLERTVYWLTTGYEARQGSGALSPGAEKR